jgi:hypothetical protein
MSRPNSGLTWIRQPHVDRVIRDLVRHPTLTHETLDQLPSGRTTNYLRSLLVEHDVIPSLDERLARLQSWSATAQGRISTEEHRKVIARFVRWSLAKRLRAMDPVTNSAFLSAKQTLTVTIDFCNWLATEYDTTIGELTQGHVDLWQSTGPITREHIFRFVRWAIKAKLISAALAVTPHRRGTAPRMPSHQQNAVIEKVVHQTRFLPATGWRRSWLSSSHNKRRTSRP